MKRRSFLQSLAALAALPFAPLRRRPVAEVQSLELSSVGLFAGDDGAINAVPCWRGPSRPVGGTFTLTYRGATTGPLPYDATPEQFQAAVDQMNRDLRLDPAADPAGFVMLDAETMERVGSGRVV